MAPRAPAGAMAVMVPGAFCAKVALLSSAAAEAHQVGEEASALCQGFGGSTHHHMRPFRLALVLRLAKDLEDGKHMVNIYIDRIDLYNRTITAYSCSLSPSIHT